MSTRRRLDPEQSRAMILDATERLMRREGYAAVTTRRVAAEAGLKPPLVHYYFPTTEDLILAFYRRSADQTHQRLLEALTSDRPLRALWELNVDPERTALAAEFIALANHRKALGAEIARQVEIFRDMQLEVFARALGDRPLGGCSPAGAAVLLAGAARALVMEDGIGVSSGHAEARAFVEWCIDHLEGKLAPASEQLV